MNLRKTGAILIGAMTFLVLGNISVMAQSKTTSQTQNTDPTYIAVIHKRAAKIVDKLAIKDAAKYKSVENVIAQQYFDLNQIYTLQDAQLKTLKAAPLADKALQNKTVDAIKANALHSTDSLHPLYLARLHGLLDDKQVDLVKDGMTYSVLEVTYKAYMEMIPTLTNAQKVQIMTWLVEAREHAIDAGSSEKKHAWFGKYKGRINNYLSTFGIDMKKQENDWQQRIKDAKKSS